MFHSISKDKNVKTASSLALFLVVSLGLNACGEEKKNKRHQTETEKVAEVVAPPQNDKPVEAEKKVDVNQPAEEEKKADEPKVETPAVEPAQPETPAAPQEPEAPVVEPTPEPAVACTMEVIDYCVQTGKGKFERVQFGRSAPECEFPEAPENTVDAAFCEKDSDSKSL